MKKLAPRTDVDYFEIPDGLYVELSGVIDKVAIACGFTSSDTRDAIMDDVRHAIAGVMDGYGK